MNEPNEFLADIVKKSEKDAESLSDAGHLELVSDLTALLANATTGTYHDFHQNGLAAPKIALVQKLHEIEEKVKDGGYDN